MLMIALYGERLSRINYNLFILKVIRVEFMRKISQFLKCLGEIRPIREERRPHRPTPQYPYYRRK